MYFNSQNVEMKKSHRLDTAELRKLKKSDFGIPELREFPIPDAAHVRAAEAYFRYAPEEYKPQLAYRILLKAKKFGVKVESTTVLDWAEKYQ